MWLDHPHRICVTEKVRKWIGAEAEKEATGISKPVGKYRSTLWSHLITTRSSRVGSHVTTLHHQWGYRSCRGKLGNRNAASQVTGWTWESMGVWTFRHSATTEMMVSGESWGSVKEASAWAQQRIWNVRSVWLGKGGVGALGRRAVHRRIAVQRWESAEGAVVWVDDGRDLPKPFPERQTSVWTPATHKGDLEGDPGCWL